MVKNYINNELLKFRFTYNSGVMSKLNDYFIKNRCIKVSFLKSPFPVGFSEKNKEYFYIKNGLVYVIGKSEFKSIVHFYNNKYFIANKKEIHIHDLSTNKTIVRNFFHKPDFKYTLMTKSNSVYRDYEKIDFYISKVDFTINLSKLTDEIEENKYYSNDFFIFKNKKYKYLGFVYKNNRFYATEPDLDYEKLSEKELEKIEVNILLTCDL